MVKLHCGRWKEQQIDDLKLYFFFVKNGCWLYERSLLISRKHVSIELFIKYLLVARVDCQKGCKIGNAWINHTSQ